MRCPLAIITAVITECIMELGTLFICCNFYVYILMMLSVGDWLIQREWYKFLMNMWFTCMFCYMSMYCFILCCICSFLTCTWSEMANKRVKSSIYAITVMYSQLFRHLSYIPWLQTYIYRPANTWPSQLMFHLCMIQVRRFLNTLRLADFW